MDPYLLMKEREFLPLLRTDGGTPVTAEMWPARRAELKALLETHSYGRTPETAFTVRGECSPMERVPGGRAVRQRLRVTVETEKGAHSFPVEICAPEAAEKPPVILYLAFRPLPDRAVPLDLITEAGYALAAVVYTDLVNDGHSGDFSDGIGACFGTGPARAPDEWGKIGMWAWGASRVLDALILCRPDLDASRTAIAGHSRLGKTALWCAALDERFAAAISNDSGYGGAATSKRGTGERVTDFIRAGSWDWFSENFKEYAGEEEDRKPYDQSFLLAMIAPRFLCVGSALDDAGADPVSEFLTTLCASEAWELLGFPGLILPERRMPRPGDLWAEGNAAYHLRAGEHALTPEDWTAYLSFLDLKYNRTGTARSD